MMATLKGVVVLPNLGTIGGQRIWIGYTKPGQISEAKVQLDLLGCYCGVDLRMGLGIGLGVLGTATGSGIELGPM